MNQKKAQIIILRIVRNKYVITFLIFYFWLFFFDQHSVWERIGNEDTIESLEKEKAYFIEKIETDKNRIHELKTNRKNLEKFAREQYLMKKKGEDIFIMIEE
ncbi:septum formation initiator family protein [Labilibaculum sp. A4]|uniref:Septum formation initiator family protein n=1 Tax=Labilibaculum euxinus TaxID=2686357 RepID=A0A425YCB8_9BACT|nr:septum formation initiator family protein [Labilibaculum euxinus]MDQ1769636.1 septum formation initiator family protein [Labilibaculum euxinus]MUP36211.1 septum formation initiator family protein [Labilibaculum euxinus]MVB05416.1 septum formation initiator family protein [Labilibaculum euxinus]MWN76193.1 septum formation initiator family protein [Labilibaculum euxinus]